MGSSPIRVATAENRISCGFSSFGRARPCQGRGGGFEPRNPLHMAPWPSGKARVCKTLIPGPIPGGASKTQKTPDGCLLCFPVIIELDGLCTQNVQNPVRNIRSAGGTPKFRVAPPSVPVLKDAGRKTRDFLGFSSFFAVFLTFLKFGF